MGSYRGSLHGIPWGAKDLLATEGIPTTWGATPFKDQVLDHNAAVVQRLSDAGAILVAKLSMGSLAWGANWFGGKTRNPWNPETDASGSSAGSGAATAAGLVGFSIGTETWGSILSPSHTCGVAGLRPTFGRVSRFGAMALAWSMDKIGPMCRSVEGCAAVFASITGPDERDSATSAAPFVWPDLKDLTSLRVGYIESEFEALNEDDMRVYREALETLRDQGIRVDPVRLPACPSGLLLTMWVEAAAAFDDLARSSDIDLLKQRDSSKWTDAMRAARSIPAVTYLRTQRLRTQLVSDFCELMKEWDAIIAPGRGEESLTITNLTGHPALILPCGFVDGMPRGMTLIGRLWHESAILKIGQAYETVTYWHNQHPVLDQTALD
jgi:Asp-tRNA(Asn)/Glu-tRNA(Gln) amidotransferase A subunit family amidase